MSVFVLNKTDNVGLAKMFNNMYATYNSMSESVPESQVDLKNLLKAEYHQLGVFLDSRCDPKRYTKVLIDVSDVIIYN